MGTGGGGAGGGGGGGGDEVMRWWLVNGSGKGGAKPDGLVIVNMPYSYSR